MRRWLRCQFHRRLPGRKEVYGQVGLGIEIRGRVQEDIMQMAITFMAVVAGMIFSLAVALLTEELIFGQVFRLFFAQQAAAVKQGQKR